MTTWARINNGVVVELTTIDPTDRFHSNIVWVVIPEGVAVTQRWTYIGEVFAPPAARVFTAEQQATLAYSAFINAGMAVVCVSAPEINGVYALDQTSQSNIEVEAQFVSTYTEFTTGATTDLPWTLADGTPVVFPTMPSFMAFAKAIALKVAAAKRAAWSIAGGVPATMPSSGVDIP